MAGTWIMQKMALNVVFASGLFLWQFTATSAQELASSPPNSEGNLAPDFYVKVNCPKPDKPTLRKPNYDDNGGIALYNGAVRRYNALLNAFDSCINDFVDKAPSDIDWITFAVNTAVAKANNSQPPIAPSASGNMPSDFYPSPHCITPDRQLGAVPNGHDVKAMDAYNTGARTFNVLARDFNACIKDYVARARVDIERIERAQRAAAAQASE